jgi:hypothetical protein
VIVLRLKPLRLDILFGIVSVALILVTLTAFVIEQAGERTAFLSLIVRFLDLLSELALALLFALVGLFILLKRPGHTVGLALLLTALGLSLYFCFDRLAQLAEEEFGRESTIFSTAATLYSANWPFILGGMFFLVLVFPSGRLASRRWRWLVRIWTAAALVTSLSYFVIPDMLEPPYEDVSGPFASEALRSLEPVSFAAAFVLLVSIFLAVVGCFLRYRGATQDEKRQFRWLALSGALAAISTPFTSSTETATSLTEKIASIVQVIAFYGFPVSVGIAVLKYRLYDIDRILNRTLTYGLLTAGLAALYFGLVVGLQAALRSVSGGSDLAIVVTTLVVAALFLPARRRVQTAVDRRFNRRAYDAARTIDAFSIRLREQIDLDSLRYELLTVVDETMQPARASLWLLTREVAR